VVLSEGRLIEQGTHAELMAVQGSYCELFSIQADAYARADAA
jgi:ATP-binding cassette subfamily B protein